MSNRKIAFFVTSMHGGGAERVTLTIAKGLADRGYAVDLLLVSAEGSYMKMIPDNINIIDFGKSRTVKTIPDVIRYLRREKPESMVCAMGHVGLVALIGHFFSRSKTKIIVGIHSTVSVSSQELKPLRRKLFYWLTRLLFTRATFIIGVSKGVADDFQKWVSIPAEKMRVLYNPVVTKQLKEDMHKLINHPWLQEKTTPVILAAGRFVPAKDFGMLITAFQNVVSQKKARLIIIGDGGQREILTNLIHKLDLDNYIDLPGFVDNPYPYMKQADLFVLSSSFEGLPTVLIEAMACGCPVVSTDCPSGPKEILESGKYGRLVPVGDPNALADAILQSLSEKQNITEIEERAEHFSEDRIVDEYLSLLLSS